MAAYLMLISVMFVAINLVVDLLYFAIDPRLRAGGQIAPAVQPKIDNTEAFVRKIVRNVEPRPWPWMTPRMDEAFRDLVPDEGE